MGPCLSPKYALHTITTSTLVNPNLQSRNLKYLTLLCPALIKIINKGSERYPK